jgi:RNA polymerase sigma-70 factor (ECF subfamily)
VRYSAAAHRAAAFFGAGSDAADVVQDAFVKAFGSLERFRDGAAFRPWLLRIVANEAKNTVRARGRREALARRALELPSAIDPAGDSAGDPAGEAVASERRRDLLAAVRRLREEERSVVVCRYFLELSEQETAEVLGLPRGTVKSRTSRALVRLRSRLESRPVEEVP